MRNVLVIAIVLLAAGCRSGEKPAPRPSPPRLEAGAPALPVGAFNRLAEESDEPWTRSPLLAAAEFLRLDETTAAETSMVVRTEAEGQGPTRVLVDLVGLLDDSIRSQRYVLAFTRESDGTWRLRSARWSQRCAPGRGHQTFSAGACI